MKIQQQVEYGLQGQFKVDIYNREDKLIDSTDYFSNFITQTGLHYPLYYNFADCFRYLSLGSNGSANTMDVTGLMPVGSPVAAKVKDYDDGVIGIQWWDYLGDAHLDKQSNSSAGSCGTIVGADGPSFYRGWKLPTGDNVYTEDIVPISEFVVSPSTGMDETGKWAFSRVPRSVLIPSGTKTIITYMLNVKIKHTGVSYFYDGTFKTDNAEISEQEHLVDSFGHLSGYYRQCYHGLRCVDNQGRTFIPKYGDPMEPSQVRLSDLAIYFSPENGQFDVNRHAGGQTDVYKAYATDGLCALSFNHDLAKNANVPDNQILAQQNAKMAFSSYPDDTSSPFEHHPSIRLKPPNDEKPPRLIDYTQSTSQSVDLNDSNYGYISDADAAISMATYGKERLQGNQFDRGFKAAYSSMMSNLGVSLADFTGRRRNIVRKAFITPINALGHNSRFGSLVYAMKNGDDYWPAVDCMFFDTSGRSVMQHYRAFDGCYLTERGRGIIKSRLTTQPSTNGGFNLETIHGPIVYDPNLAESRITGHSGFYEGSQTTNTEWPYETINLDPTAVRISGPTALTANTLPGAKFDFEWEHDVTAGYLVPGDTGTFAPDHVNAGKVVVDGELYYGVGAIQGNLFPTSLDYGIADHRIAIQTGPICEDTQYETKIECEANIKTWYPDGILARTAIQEPPTAAGITDEGAYSRWFSTDDLYWPNVDGGKLNFSVADLHYYDAGLGIIADPDVWTCSDSQYTTEATCLETDGTCLNGTDTNKTDCESAASEWTATNAWASTEKGYFSAQDQMVADLTFNTDLDTFVNQTLDPTQKIPLTSITENYVSNTQHVGFFLSRATGYVAVDRYQQSQALGAHDTAKTYSIGDIVDNDGSLLYMSKVDDNTEDSLTDTSKWKQLDDSFPIPYDGIELEALSTSLNTSVAMGILRDNMTTFAGVCDDVQYATKDQCTTAGKTWIVQAVTGYLVPAAHLTNGNITNTTWVGDTDPSVFPPAGYVQIPTVADSSESVFGESMSPYFGAQQASNEHPVGVVTNMFDGFGSYPDRATNMVARRSGDGLDAQDGNTMAFIFSGCDMTPAAKQTPTCSDTQFTTEVDCYETEGSCSAGGHATKTLCQDAGKTWTPTNEWYGHGTDAVYVLASRGEVGVDMDWNPTTEFQGTIKMTDFLPPEGYFLHYESPRLLPNFAKGSATADSFKREEIDQGGVYPGMSNLNTLEVYMDIAWSAPCAGVAGCIEEEA
jgi:hypothetical protein